ncbi:Murein DD-endopeptidase MepM and murein hydrolase activator NlpD, contain LysM domain [Blastococcus aurantiacus]|uniref:Murein DD-endopeptidase MepM and murein hydrolase activator NlpD, contain LysM domain n=1 Tax=Blastococcus aurantiacus TaxID=1550231 RepID=A0A1G7PS72_9ACTN|nr:M23 family metallopeptidase [Blastococcus aurantiacus]SDF88250.1 Murein DD-endopeptidase MepM and murein hydrolase activator NlpD, contain LysM domain [Blastococcus aurantiacus]
MSPTSAPTLLERPGPEDGATGRIELGRGTPAIPVPRPATTAPMRAAAAADAEAAAGNAVPAETAEPVVADPAGPAPQPGARRRLPRFAALRRLPHPPGRRAPIWFAALVAGALVAGAPAILDGNADRSDVTASDLGLGTDLDHGFSGGLEDADVRRGITEAEAQARLGELAASRAARQPKTVLPVTGRLTTCFCQRWGTMHYGLDLAAPLGTPIFAASDGVVLRAGSASGYGNAVYVQDADGNVHIYGHMRYYDVSAGDIVHAGDQIAKVGNEGQSTGPHLHYEIHRGGMHGRPTDPRAWLAERGVSL